MFGWNVKLMTQKIFPILVTDNDLFLKSLNGIVRVGYLKGTRDRVLTELDNGSQIETEILATTYDEDTDDFCSWRIESEPNSTKEITCASVVNRLIQIKNARSGYIPTFELGIPSTQVN